MSDFLESTFALALMALVVSAWFTHIFVTISDDRIALLLAGVFFPPIGVVHGIGVFIGVW